MSRQRRRVTNTQLDNLVSNLRGEVGEVITAWILLRHLMVKERGMMSSGVAKDLVNQDLTLLGMLTHKLTDEIVARLSELGEAKIGRLNFHFAATKLGELSDQVEEFRTFISRNRFQEKRNYDISHKELPEQWSQHKHIHISYRTLLRGIGGALRLMKAIDTVVLGPSAEYLWREMRKRRYVLMSPASSAYLLLPHLYLSREVRSQIVLEELAEGREVWTQIPTTIDGREAELPACRPWGAIVLGGRMIVLDQYPLQRLESISVSPPHTGGAEEALSQAKPITAQRTITAKYRVTEKSETHISFAPVQRQHSWGDGSVTDLVDIHVNLNDKLRQDFASMLVGDEKEFGLTVTAVVGYEMPPPSANIAGQHQNGGTQRSGYCKVDRRK